MQRGYSLIILIVVFGVLAVISGGFYFYLESKKVIIDSFEACAKKYPVLESYPEQCNTPDGKHFVREISDEEKQNLVLPFEASSSANPNESINWKVYINNEYDYSLQYPTEYKITEAGYPVGAENASDIIISPSKSQTLGMSIYVIKKDYAIFKDLILEQIAKENFTASQTNPHNEAEILEQFKETTLGGKQAFSYVVRSNGYSGKWDGELFAHKASFKVVEADYEGNHYRIYFNIEDPKQVKILQSFKFTSY